MYNAIRINHSEKVNLGNVPELGKNNLTYWTDWSML